MTWIMILQLLMEKLLRKHPASVTFLAPLTLLIF